MNGFGGSKATSWPPLIMKASSPTSIACGIHAGHGWRWGRSYQGSTASNATVMRHSDINLTMNTYGHLFPGQEADAVAKMRDMMATNPPEVIRATGTDDLAILEDDVEQRAAHAQRATRETGQDGANHCDERAEPVAQKESPKPLQIADLSDGVLDVATLCTSSGGGTRTPDTRIMIPLL